MKNKIPGSDSSVDNSESRAAYLASMFYRILFGLGRINNRQPV
jgi:hypothetical protein